LVVVDFYKECGSFANSRTESRETKKNLKERKKSMGGKRVSRRAKRIAETTPKGSKRFASALEGAKRQKGFVKIN